MSYRVIYFSLDLRNESFQSLKTDPFNPINLVKLFTNILQRRTSLPYTSWRDGFTISLLQFMINIPLRL